MTDIDKSFHKLVQACDGKAGSVELSKEDCHNLYLVISTLRDDLSAKQQVLDAAMKMYKTVSKATKTFEDFGE